MKQKGPSDYGETNVLDSAHLNHCFLNSYDALHSKALRCLKKYDDRLEKEVKRKKRWKKKVATTTLFFIRWVWEIYPVFMLEK